MLIAKNGYGQIFDEVYLEGVCEHGSSADFIEQTEGIPPHGDLENPKHRLWYI